VLLFYERNQLFMKAFLRKSWHRFLGQRIEMKVRLFFIFIKLQVSEL